jgi:hypothetical protein
MSAEENEEEEVFTNVELMLDDGRSITVRALDVEPTDIAFEGLTARFSDFADTVRDIAKITADALSAVKPSEATLEFGLDVGVKAGAVTALFAGGEAKATLKVTLRWVDQTEVTLRWVDQTE